MEMQIGRKSRMEIYQQAGRKSRMKRPAGRKSILKRQKGRKSGLLRFVTKLEPFFFIYYN